MGWTEVFDYALKNVFFSHSPPLAFSNISVWIFHQTLSSESPELRLYSTIWPSWNRIFDVVWNGNTGKGVFNKLLSMSYQSTSANSVRTLFFRKKLLTFWSAIHVSLQVLSSPCVLAKQKMICRQRQPFLRHLLRLEAYNFVIRLGCEAKFCRTAVEWLQIYFMQKKIPDFIPWKNDPSRKRILAQISENTFFWSPHIGLCGSEIKSDYYSGVGGGGGAGGGWGGEPSTNKWYLHNV